MKPILMCAAMLCAPAFGATAYYQLNLASDITGLAANLDTHLKNPWGMSFGPTTPFWVSNQGSSDATLYNGAGVPQPVTPTPLVVTTPPGPTGQVFNFTPSFLLPTGGKALFMFASLSGAISAWNGAQGTTAITEFLSTNGAVYTGLAIGNAFGDRLYAANFAGGAIDMIDGSFGLISSNAFADPNLPAGYSPYNIQAIGNLLYVEYAKANPATGRAGHTPNTGIVDVFDMNGIFVKRLVTDTNLNSPWGVTQAPAGFGSFAGAILVGNFGDGTISAFDPTTGTFLGQISGQNGGPIVNSGLWALNFRAAGSGFDPNTLFLNAGINNEADGLFAEIQVVPEPGTWMLVTLALGGLCLARRRRA